jgi:sodium/potassium-transporting ATPase subunit alpha
VLLVFPWCLKFDLVEIVPILLTLSFGFPPLLSSLQILSVDLFTELAPAISLAYEKREKDVMDQPPRKVKEDRLVSFPLLLYSYLIAGLLIEATACFLASCIVFWTYNISISDIAFIDGKKV